MVMWFRQKYPHVALGAWSSSGPLLGQLDFPEYMEVVGAALRAIGGDECYDNLEAIFGRLNQMVVAKEFDRIKQVFSLCDDYDLNDKRYISEFLDKLVDPFATTVQYNR